MQLMSVRNGMNSSVSSSVNLIELDDLTVKRKSGGSIVDQRPLFSCDGESLYIIWKNVIKVCSTQTGDFVQEFEPSDYKIVGILMHPDNMHMIIGCTEKGQLDFWCCQNNIITRKLCGSKIYVLLFDIENGTCIKSIYILHKTGNTSRLPTCIAGHPIEECVATGDNTGRVVVWRGLFQTRPYTAVFHWHTLPVTEIMFSKSGGHMYTGGSECVLVKWTLANPQHKSFLPRLSAPIKHLTIAPDNSYVAVSMLDNGILIVNPQKKQTTVIQNFTWGIVSSSKDLFPAGLTVDPRTGCLVLNSRTGHVQFYNTHTKNLLYNINITAQNFLTQERDVIIVNTEVTKIALNPDGTWMATVEERNDKVSYIEVRLKFWRFDWNKQIYILNTAIELPHENGVNALQFQPNKTLNDDKWLAITTGKDNKFKLWILGQPSSVQEETRQWHCHAKNDYRGLTITDAGFSMDGSLLAIGFHSTLTIWIPETCKLENSLTHIQYDYPITSYMNMNAMLPIFAFSRKCAFCCCFSDFLTC
ncbi:WD repeat-containing protein 75 [Harpegnathos saltator]|uniref:WD repeat-containing protein 75 n=1 Tax=Harpegnathos saltator TaxID=610380 RepID=E2C6T6_HARSA|nr:WD repeat-containing protein 75 [Harpegnathos saltator]